MEKPMLISKDNKGNVTGWLETYFSNNEIVTVSVNGMINTITTQDRTTGKFETKTFFGKSPLPNGR
jgi:hypothetical protein